MPNTNADFKIIYIQKKIKYINSTQKFLYLRINK
jgi:hypothetical protein